MKISKCDNSLITVQKQTVIVGANSIRPKQRLGRMLFAPTVKKEGGKKKSQKQCHFCYFCNLTLVNLSISQPVYLKNKVTLR